MEWIRNILAIGLITAVFVLAILAYPRRPW